MDYTFIMVTIVAYMFVLFKFKKDIVVQLLAVLVIYLASVTFREALDATLPIFFIVSLVPFLGNVRHLSKWTLFLVVFLGIYLIVGVLFQDSFRAITMFVSRCWQFVFFFIVFDSVKLPSSKTNFHGLIIVSILVEAVLAAYLFLTKRELFDVVRLTAGAQPITGNMAVVIMPVICYAYFCQETNENKRLQTIGFVFLLALFVGLSGTRGYELIYLLTTICILWDYAIHAKSTRSFVNRYIVFSLATLAMIGIVMMLPEYLERLATIFRLNKFSVGIRGYENAAGMEFMMNAPLLVKLFGVGMGGKLGNYPEFVQAVSKQFALGMWNQWSYLNNAGSIFHNLYMNILCNMGICGIVVLGASIVKIWMIISSVISEKRVRIAYKAFFVSFIIMNYYRWSVDCGIAIMALFALMLKAIREVDKKRSPESMAYMR